MKLETLKTRLQNIGFRKDRDAEVWRNNTGKSVSFLSDDVIRVESGSNVTLCRVSDIVIRNGYVNVKKAKAECLKYYLCGEGKCDMCLVYEFPKIKRKGRCTEK